MSLVVALSHKNRIILGSDKQVSFGNNKNHSCIKIWEVKGLPGAIMGGVGTARASQIIQYTDIIDKNDLQVEPTTEFVVNSLVPIIVGVLKQNGVVVEPDAENEASCIMMPNTFIFAYKDKAWLIYNDLSVQEIEDYMVIGSGADVARGVLWATSNSKNPFDRITQCIEAAAESTLFVDDGIDILVTEDRAGDDKMLAKAFGLQLVDLAKMEALVKEKAEIIEEQTDDTKEDN